MDNIKNLGWPYNLYSAISGISVPDNISMQYRSYYYKYQKGFYCFFFTDPDSAESLMKRFLYRSCIDNDISDFQLSCILYVYAFGKSYDEIICLSKNNTKYWLSILYYLKIDIFKIFPNGVHIYNPSINKEMIKKELEVAIRKLYRSRTYIDYFRIWPKDIKQPKYHKFVTQNDRLKLYLNSNKTFKHGIFTVYPKVMHEKGIDFYSKIDNVLYLNTFEKILNDAGICTLQDLESSSIKRVIESLPSDAVRSLFAALKEIGLVISSSKLCYYIKRAKINDPVSTTILDSGYVHDPLYIPTPRKMHPYFNHPIYNFDNTTKLSLEDIKEYYSMQDPEVANYNYLNSIGIRYIPDMDDYYDQ